MRASCSSAVNRTAADCTPQHALPEDRGTSFRDAIRHQPERIVVQDSRTVGLGERGQHG